MHTIYRYYFILSSSRIVVIFKLGMCSVQKINQKSLTQQGSLELYVDIASHCVSWICVMENGMQHTPQKTCQPHKFAQPNWSKLWLIISCCYMPMLCLFAMKYLILSLICLCIVILFSGLHMLHMSLATYKRGCHHQLSFISYMILLVNSQPTSRWISYNYTCLP